jgi:hypothetical protein
MKKLSRLGSVLFILTIAVMVCAAGKTKAVNGQQPQGITVSPAFQQVNVSQSESAHPLKFFITNNQSAAQTVHLSSQDFSTVNENGGLLFVGTNPTQLQKRYGLAKWLSLPQTQVSIPPKQTTALTAQILNLPDLAPGGHYGALMLALGQQANGSNNVAVHPVASSLLFVTKLGGDTHKLSLANVYVKHTIFSLPSAVTLRFHNNGNTHIVPRGFVSLANSNGEVISKGVINANSDIVLPQTYRQLLAPLPQLAHSNSIGKYTLSINFRFDGIDQFRAYKQSFIYIPIMWLIGILVIVVGIGFLIVKVRRIKK